MIILTEGENKNMISQKDATKDNTIFGYIISFCTILLPGITVNSYPTIKAEQILVVIFTMFYLVQMPKIYKSHFLIMYSLFSIIIVLSIIIGRLFGIKPILNDFFEIYKIIIYGGTYFIVSSIIKEYDNKIKMLKFINVCIFLTALIGISQYFNFLGLNEKYVQMLSSVHSLTLINNYPYPRPIGLIGNPNLFSAMLGIGIIINLFFIKNSQVKKMKYYLFFLIELVACIMTGSRGGIIFVGVSSLVYFFIDFRVTTKKKNVMKYLACFIIIILMFFAIIRFVPTTFFWRFKSLINIKGDESWLLRLIGWKENINLFKMDPFLGVGPAKSIKYMYAADNEWLLLLKQYGVIGVVYLIGIFTLPFMINMKNKCKAILNIYLSLLPGIAMYMIVLVFYNSFELMTLMMIIAALSVNHNKNYEKIEVE